MTVAERMRRMGWTPFVAGMWQKWVCGVPVIVAGQERARDGMTTEPGFFVFYEWTEDERSTSNVYHGLVSVAQMATAAARKLARKRGK